MKSFNAGTNDDGVRLNRFCEKVCPNIPKSLLHKSFRNKRIKVNGKKQDADYRIKQGDLLELYINDEFFENYKKDQFETVDFAKLNILYEDKNIIIIFKPAGILCHSDNKQQSNIVDMVKSYLAEKGEFSCDKENTFTPSLCNRIDQGTDGIVVAAKNYKALAEMNRLITQDMIIKQYLCIIQHPIENGEYKAFLSRDLMEKKVTVTAHQTLTSKEIITDFNVVSQKGAYYLVECTLITGRTHQIRAHLAFLGCPILGDRKYGKPTASLDSQLLSGYKIKFKTISQGSILEYLSGKEFQCQDCNTLKYFSQLQ
ncbi:MAG: RluA family pseudouridine synthase [Oscillospiraceae bacterium]